MHVRGVEPNTGKEADLEIPEDQQGFFEALANLDLSDSAIKRMIDRLDISADAKSLLYSLSKASILIGERIVKIGRKILDYVCKMLKEFPHTALGLILGGVAAALFSAIPGLGFLLGPLISPILMLVGFVGGVVIDFQDKMLTRKISARVAEQNERLAERIDQKIAEIHSASSA